MINIPSIIKDMSNSEYHACEGISRSALMEFSKSPLHYWNKYINPNRKPQEPSKAMRIGSAFHCYVMEPHKFLTDFIVQPKIDRRTNAGKDQYARFSEENLDKIILSEEEFSIIEIMADRFQNNDSAPYLVSGHHIEHSMFWEDKDTGLILKCRPDVYGVLPNGDTFVVDIKTTNDGSPSSFSRSIANHGYHVQAAMIQDGMVANGLRMPKDFFFIVAETEEPYSVEVYKLENGSYEYDDERGYYYTENGNSALEKGIKKYKEILRDLKNYDKTKIEPWKSYGVQTVFLPKWSM